MNFLKKVLLFWCWTTCNLINHIESQYNSMWQQQYLPSPSQQQLPQNQRQQRTLIKISASGFLPFENDILPYAILQRLLNEKQKQEERRRQQQSYQYSSTYDYNRGGRYMQWQSGPQPKNLLEYAKRLQNPKVRATIKNLNANQQSSFTKTQPGAQYYYKNPKWLKSKKLQLQRTSSKSKHYKLYDADGEYLLDLRYHNNGNNNHNDNSHGDDDVEKVANFDVDNESSADTKTPHKIMSKNIGIGAATTTTFYEDAAEKGVDNYNNSNSSNHINELTNENYNNTTTWQMSAPTLSKSKPIVVEDSKLKTTAMMPTSPEWPTTSTQKRVQHIWLHL